MKIRQKKTSNGKDETNNTGSIEQESDDDCEVVYHKDDMYPSWRRTARRMSCLGHFDSQNCLTVFTANRTNLKRCQFLRID